MLDLDHHPADAALNPVVGQRWDAPGPRRIAPHAHRRGQLIYAESGGVAVEAGDFHFVLPPDRAAWVPPGVRHGVRYAADVAFRGLFVARDLCAVLPDRCAVVSVDPLARELIREAVRIPWDYAEESREARLMQVLIDRLAVLPAPALRLPEGRDRRVRRVIQALRDDPADPRGVDAWAAVVHSSERTLARRFLADTGLTFAAWRRRLRLLTAMQRIAAGDSVTRIAIDLGYRTTSSFTTMFTRELGVPPTRYFRVEK